jgi:hypothetical protein
MRFVTAALSAAVVLLALASPAPAAITIGSGLTASDGTSECAEGGAACTGVVTAIPGRTIASPITGVVVRWRVGDGVGQLTFRVARPAGNTYPGDNTHTGGGRSAPVTITAAPSDVGEPPVISTFPTRLPISAGDHIGVDLTASSRVGFRDRGGAEVAVFFPPLGVGERRASDFVLDDFEVLVNADVEPDADRDGFGDETQDQCSTDPTTQGLCRGRCANLRVGTARADTLVADVGKDDLDGGSGRDQMSGGAGADRLRGGSAGDRGSGGAGRDRISGGSGNDRMDGGSANDVVSGGAGRDRLSGASGRDRLDGGSGADRVSGGKGGDRMLGGKGADQLIGGAGNDRIVGGAGGDRIRVGGGANRVSAGGGRDRIAAANGRKDRISCGKGRDRVVADAKDRVSPNCERVIRR